MNEDPQSKLASGMRAQEVLAAVGEALGADDVERAAQLAEQAVAQGFEHPLFYNLAASRHETRREFSRAVELLERGLALAPGDLGMMTALGMCLNRLRRTERALAVFDGVLALRPDFAPARYGKGVGLLGLGDFAGARRCFAAAADLLPGYAEPLGSLAALEARLGDAKTARSLAERALAINPGLIAARSAMASCELEARAFPNAEALARGLLSDPEIAEDERAPAQTILGDALDGQGRVDEAIKAYEAAKATLGRLHATEFERPGLETFPQFLARLTSWVSQLRSEDWKRARGLDESGARGHVFITGFGRSGTTLLETALASHPQVVSLDESDALRWAAAELVGSNAGMDRLAALDDAAAGRLRRAYWQRVAQLGVDVRGKVFVDKAPYSAVLLPVISALFPDARVLFALRDPRDVVLSCFRRGFAVTAVSHQFKTLESTALIYDGYMNLAMLEREKLPLNLREVRYETLSRDFENEARAISAFLDLDWSPELKNFAETARARPSATPSARQLTRGLYSGAGQWRPYAKHLEPLTPILKPWIERFGYGPTT
jgi:tetratricopeptide (TPR) repeat protein